MLFYKIGVGVPGIPLLGLVAKGLQEIPAHRLFGPARIRFRRRQRLAFAALVKETCHPSGLRVYLQPHEIVLATVTGGFEFTRSGRRFCSSASVLTAIAKTRHAGLQQQMG